MAFRALRGKINYVSHQKGDPIQYGSERFTYTWQDDGQWTVRSLCEIQSGVVRKRHVIRDVTYSMDKEFNPVDCFVRLHQDGEFLGSGWFRFGEDFAECESVNKLDGRIRQRFELERRAPSFGPHALTCDITHCAKYDHSSGQKIQPATGVLMSSLEHDGCSGPSLSSIDFKIEYAGRESVTVPAGTFDADHYIFHLEGTLPDEHPTEHVWCLPDDFVFVKIMVGGYMNSTFELAELEEGL